MDIASDSEFGNSPLKQSNDASHKDLKELDDSKQTQGISQRSQTEPAIKESGRNILDHVVKKHEDKVLLNQSGGTSGPLLSNNDDSKLVDSLNVSGNQKRTSAKESYLSPGGEDSYLNFEKEKSDSDKNRTQDIQVNILERENS